MPMVTLRTCIYMSSHMHVHVLHDVHTIQLSVLYTCIVQSCILFIVQSPIAFVIISILHTVPMDLDVKMKAVMVGATFLIVSHL